MMVRKVLYPYDIAKVVLRRLNSIDWAIADNHLRYKQRTVVVVRLQIDGRSIRQDRRDIVGVHLVIILPEDQAG
jgi:hypothetical protein